MPQCGIPLLGNKLVFMLANFVLFVFFINIFRAHDADEKAMSQQKAINAKG